MKVFYESLHFVKRKQNHSVLPLRCKMMQNSCFQHIFFKVRKMASKCSQNVRKWFLSVLWVPKDSKQTSKMFWGISPKIFEIRMFDLGSRFFKVSSARASFSFHDRKFEFEKFLRKSLKTCLKFVWSLLGPREHLEIICGHSGNI